MSREVSDDWLLGCVLMMLFLGALVLTGYGLSYGWPAPIDHHLDAQRAGLVRSWTSGPAPEAPEEVKAWIGDRRCCLECDGRVTCASVVECGGVACRGRDVKIRLPWPCGARAFCGGGDE